MRWYGCRHRVVQRIDELQVSKYGHEIFVREMPVHVPRHRRQNVTICFKAFRLAPADGSFKLFKGPVANTRIIGRQVGGERHAPGSDKRGQPHVKQYPLTGILRNIRHGLRSEEHTSELQSRENLVCRLLLEKKKKKKKERSIQ